MALPAMGDSKGAAIAKLSAGQLKQVLQPITDPITKAVEMIKSPRALISAATGGLPIVEQLLDFGTGLKNIVFGKSKGDSVEEKLDDQNEKLDGQGETLDDIRDNQKSLLKTVAKFFAFSKLMGKLDTLRENRRDARAVKNAALERSRFLESTRERLRGMRGPAAGGAMASGAGASDGGGGFFSGLLGGLGMTLGGAAGLKLSAAMGLSAMVGIMGKLIKGLITAIAGGIARIFGAIGMAGKAIQKILTGIARGIAAFGKASVFKGIGALALLGAALLPWSFSLKQFKDIDWDQVMKGALAIGAFSAMAALLGVVGKQAIAGSVAMTILGVALIPFSHALGMFADVEWDSVIKGGIALAGFSVIAGILGTPPIVAAVIAGSVAIGAMGLALIPFAGAMNIFALAMPAFSTAFTVFTEAIGGLVGTVGNTLERILDKFIELSKQKGSGLVSMAKGIALVTGALAGFVALDIVAGVAGTVSNVVSSMGNWVSGFFGGEGIKSPLQALAALASLGEASGGSLAASGQGVANLAKGLKELNSIDIDANRMDAAMGTLLSLASTQTAAAQRLEGSAIGASVVHAPTTTVHNTSTQNQNVFDSGPTVDHGLSSAPQISG
tara:strand:+ start:44736 stop:46574 length:1839 start_codon:yes stop_codon:yes gene_type:complete